MEEEKAAAYYEELNRKGEGARRFKQGLGFSSDEPQPAAFTSKPTTSSSFLSGFVRAGAAPAQLPKPSRPPPPPEAALRQRRRSLSLSPSRPLSRSPSRSRRRRSRSRSRSRERRRRFRSRERGDRRASHYRSRSRSPSRRSGRNSHDEARRDRHGDRRREDGGDGRQKGHGGRDGGWGSISAMAPALCSVWAPPPGPMLPEPKLDAAPPPWSAASWTDATGAETRRRTAALVGRILDRRLAQSVIRY